MSFEETHNQSPDADRYADLLGSLNDVEDDSSTLHSRARHTGSFHALYDTPPSAGSTPVAGGGGALLAGQRANGGNRMTDEIDASDLMVDSEDEDSVHSQQSSLPNPAPTFQQQTPLAAVTTATAAATGKWPDTGIDAFLDLPSSNDMQSNHQPTSTAALSNDLDYFLSNSHHADQPEPDNLDGLQSKSQEEAEAEAAHTETLQVGASPDIADMFAGNGNHTTDAADASTHAPVTNALDDFLSSPMADEPSPSTASPLETASATQTIVDSQSNSRDELADDNDLQSPVKSAVGSVHEMSPPPAPIDNATTDAFEASSQQQQNASSQNDRENASEEASPDAPISESKAAAAAALDDELDSYFHAPKPAALQISSSSVDSSPAHADADTTAESVNVSAHSHLLESDADEDEGSNPAVTAGKQQLSESSASPVEEIPSPAVAAVPTVSPDAVNLKSSTAPVATTALPFPSSTHSTLSFSAAHSKSLLSLQELQYALESELFAFRQQQEEAERAFQLQQSELQSSIKRAEQQLQDLSDEKTTTREKVASLQSECESLRNQLTSLTARKLSLETAQLSLIEARRARCHRLFLESQPLFTVMRLNQAVIERKHRQYLRQFKREAISKAKARGEENIHVGGDETDEAASEAAGEFSPVNTTIRLRPRGPPQVKRERDRAQSVIHSSGATILPARRSSLPPSSLPSLGESALSEDEEQSEPSAMDLYDAEDAADTFNALPVDFPFDEAIAAMGSNGAVDTLNIFPRRYGTLRSLASLSAQPATQLEEGTPRLRLPASIIENIFSHLGVRDIQHATSVSRDWQVFIALKTQVWKHLLTRVAGVELRIKKEKEREKRVKRQQQLATPQRLERANSVSQLNENGASTVAKPAPLIHAATAVNLHADGSQHLTPPQSPASSRTPVTPSSNDVGATPETPSTTAATKSGGLFGMFRRFRGGSVTNAAAGTTPATGSAAAAANGSIISAPPTPTQSPGPNQYPQQQQQLPQLLSHQQAMHLHYDLCIEITSRDVTSIRVDGRLARSSVTIEPPTEPTSPSVPPTCTVRCGEADFSDTSKAANSVTMHLCPLRRSPHLESELEFCRQLFALQANLTQARMERAKLMSSIDGEDGIKKQHTAAMDVLKSQLAGVEYEIDRMRKQKQSDEITRDFLLQQLENMKQSLQHEKQRTEATRNERKEKAEAASVESQQAQLVRQQQAEMQTELRAHKKQLTKEVKMMQAEVERETKEKDRIKAEYEKLVATLEKLKGI